MEEISAGDTAWMLVSTALVLFMTPGLAFFYGGMVRAKNVLGMLMQNFFSIGLVSVLWAVVGFSLLEVVNYVEHYGLLRRRDTSGSYERCQPHHSWNSNHIYSNLVLFHLERHSDHHANPLRRYQSLRHFDDAPQLPTGYMGMLLLAYFPAAFFQVMDRRLLDLVTGDLGQVNQRPPQRTLRRN